MKKRLKPHLLMLVKIITFVFNLCKFEFIDINIYYKYIQINVYCSQFHRKTTKLYN